MGSMHPEPPRNVFVVLQTDHYLSNIRPWRTLDAGEKRLRAGVEAPALIRFSTWTNFFNNANAFRNVLLQGIWRRHVHYRYERCGVTERNWKSIFRRWRPSRHIRELTKRRRRRQRRRYKTIGLVSKNNGSARAFYILVHFFAVISRMTT